MVTGVRQVLAGMSATLIDAVSLARSDSGRKPLQRQTVGVGSSVLAVNWNAPCTVPGIRVKLMARRPAQPFRSGPQPEMVDPGAGVMLESVIRTRPMVLVGVMTVLGSGVGVGWGVGAVIGAGVPPPAATATAAPAAPSPSRTIPALERPSFAGAVVAAGCGVGEGRAGAGEAALGCGCGGISPRTSSKNSRTVGGNSRPLNSSFGSALRASRKRSLAAARRSRPR